MKKLLIIGTGGQGKVVLDCALEIGEYSKIAFLTRDLSAKQIAGYPVFYEQEVLGSSPSDRYIHTSFYRDFDEVIVAIGNNKVRLEQSLHFLNNGVKLAVLKHPSAVVSRFSEVGYGSVVFANAVVNPFSSIGTACIINTGAVIEHDCNLCDGVHISPNATIAGSVSIGEESWICAGSCIANNMKIGAGSIIGAGAVVLHDVPDHVLAAGVPAKIKKTISDDS